MHAVIVPVIALALLCLGTSSAADCVDASVRGMESGRLEGAVRALKKGARDADERCRFILGIWLLEGRGVKRDPEAASRWLSQAAKDGLPIAQSHLGLLYASGLGVEKDEAEAAKWYRAAAEYGDPLGQGALGAAAVLGAGVPKDLVEAYFWTSLAAAQGNERSAAYLPKIEAVLEPEEIDRARSRAAEFQPKERAERSQASRREVLRGLGFSEPREYERFFGY